MAYLQQGIDIHESINNRRISLDVLMAIPMVDMYAKFGSIDKAHDLFDRMPPKTMFSWTGMIRGYAQNEFVGKALETFKEMPLPWSSQIPQPSPTYLLPRLKWGVFEQSMDINQSTVEGGLLSDIIVRNTL